MQGIRDFISHLSKKSETTTKTETLNDDDVQATDTSPESPVIVEETMIIEETVCIDAPEAEPKSKVKKSWTMAPNFLSQHFSKKHGDKSKVDEKAELSAATSEPEMTDDANISDRSVNRTPKTKVKKSWTIVGRPFVSFSAFNHLYIHINFIYIHISFYLYIYIKVF